MMRLHLFSRKLGEAVSSIMITNQSEIKDKASERVDDQTTSTLST